MAHRKELEGKLARITELYADGSLDRAQFAERRDEINKELNQIILPSADRTLNLGHQVDTFQTSGCCPRSRSSARCAA